MGRSLLTRIVATLGPASAHPPTIAAMAQAGVRVFRLNFSHGRHEGHAAAHAAIRAVEAERGRPLAILADLQGPKLRIGTFADGPVRLRLDARIVLDDDPAPGSEARVHLPHPEIFAAAKPGDRLLLDDGRVRLEVESAAPGRIVAVAPYGGTLSDRKGLSVPDSLLPLPPLTDKDRADLAFALALGVDWVALSFVQRAADLDEARATIAGRAGLLAKIEKPQAVADLPAIIAAADAIMVARGDLGVEMPPEAVPPAQKRMVRLCAEAGKPVIVATQMLESMTAAPTPTRAEASDVANAVYDGADAVMLSAETASGNHPVPAVLTMARIIAAVEEDPLSHALLAAGRQPPRADVDDAIGHAAGEIAAQVGAGVIVCSTASGRTVARVARARPSVPIVALTPDPALARRLCLTRGVEPVADDGISGFTEAVAAGCRIAVERGLAAPGALAVVTAGVPFGEAGSTNTLRVARL